MDFTVAKKSYHNEVDGGWVTKGQIFNVGQEHKPGLVTISPARAADTVRLRLHDEWREGAPVPRPSSTDPMVVRNEASQALMRSMSGGRSTKVNPPKKKVVEPPPKTPGQGQSPNPGPPRRVGGPARQEESPAPESLTPGGPTGEGQTSPSSSAADTASKGSTGKQRGTRRNKPGAKSAGSASTEAEKKPRGQMPSTDQT